MDLVNRDTNGKATIVESNWWDPMPEDVIDKVFDEVPFPGWAFEHAAVTETSLMMYFAPELVHFERAVSEKPTVALPYFRYPLYKGDVPESGALASSLSSTSERGKIIVDSVIPELVKICKKEFGI
jgi:creatinine amidohydrolase